MEKKWAMYRKDSTVHIELTYRKDRLYNGKKKKKKKKKYGRQYDLIFFDVYL